MKASLQKIILFACVTMLGVQSITAQNWPVKNNNYCVTQGFCGTFFGFHPAIDIHDFNFETKYFNTNSQVIAIRDGDGYSSDCRLIVGFNY